MRMLLAIVVASLAASPLAASCESDKGNPLAGSNCGFDKDVSGWTASPGASLSRDAGDNGALKAVSDPQGSLTVVGPCVPVQGGSRYRIAARMRLLEGTPYFCTVNAFQYSDARCSDNAEPLGSAAGPPEATWTLVDGTATTAPGAKSVQLRPTCSGQPGFAVLFDDFAFHKG
jgi:hypothetical protein